MFRGIWRNNQIPKGHACPSTKANPWLPHPRRRISDCATEGSRPSWADRAKEVNTWVVKVVGLPNTAERPGNGWYILSLADTPSHHPFLDGICTHRNIEKRQKGHLGDGGSWGPAGMPSQFVNQTVPWKNWDHRISVVSGLWFPCISSFVGTDHITSPSIWFRFCCFSLTLICVLPLVHSHLSSPKRCWWGCNCVINVPLEKKMVVGFACVCCWSPIVCRLYIQFWSIL